MREKRKTNITLAIRTYSKREIAWKGEQETHEMSGGGRSVLRVFFTRAKRLMQLRTTIAKTCLYNFKPLKPHFHIVKLGSTGVYIIVLISAQKHRFLSENFHFLLVQCSVYLNRHVFVMQICVYFFLSETPQTNTRNHYDEAQQRAQWRYEARAQK